MHVAAAYAGAGTRRWHANPALAGSMQTIADHQARCVLLLVLLYPGPIPQPLMTYLALHDMGEARAGDLPWPFKLANPAVAEAHAEVEADMVEDLLGLALPYLTPREADWAKLIDRLESAAWCLQNAPQEYARPASGWGGSEVAILDLARRLGVLEPVIEFLGDLKGGRW